MAKVILSALVLGVNFFFLSIFSPTLLSQTNPQASAIETIKKLSAEIDQYIRDHEVPYRELIGRLTSEEDWEWKEPKSASEEEAFFEGYMNFKKASVYFRDSQVIHVSLSEWSDSGDWAFDLEYYFDDQGRILQIAADFRTLVDDIRVLDFQYFSKSGKVLDHTVEYYSLGRGEDQKLNEKPENMQNPMWDIPIYLKVSDLPFYSVLKTTPPKGNMLLGKNAWGE